MQNKSESAEKATRDSTVIQFYNRCCESAEIKRDWYSLHPHTQMQFTAAVAYIHSVVYQGG
jgi:hypothetical protein